MKLTSEELKELYRTSTARSSHRERCPDGDEFLQAADGELNLDRRETLISHLGLCSDCAEEYQVAVSLRPWARQQVAGLERRGAIDGRTMDAITPALMHDVRQKESARADKPPASRSSASTASLRRSRFPYAIAAALIALTLFMGAITAFLYRQNSNLVAQFDERLAERDRLIASQNEEIAAARRQIEESNRPKQEDGKLRPEQGPLARDEARAPAPRRSATETLKPQINVPIIQLDPGGSRGSSSNLPSMIEIPQGSSLFTLILNVSGEPQSPSYSLEIQDRRGALVWRGSGLRKSPYNTFTVGLTRETLPAGQYWILLYGLRGGRKELIESYAVAIQYQ